MTIEQPRATTWHFQLMRRLRRYGTFGHILAGLGTFITIGISVTAYFGGLFGPVVTVLENNPTILVALGFLGAWVVLGCAFTFYYLSRYKRTKAYLKDEKEVSQINLDLLERHKEVNKIARAMAHDYSRCDQHLFDVLFCDLAGGKAEQLLCLASATIYVENHIDQILTHAAALFNTVTGHPCSVTIKVIDFDDEAKKDLRKIKVKVYKRDSYTASARRETDSQPTLVVENTGDDRIILGDSGVFASNDLKALAATGGYRNPKKDWQDSYNSAIVCGIDTMSASHPLIFAAGCLCIDSRYGALDNDTAREFALAISWRLAVLLYRLNRITGKAVADLKELSYGG